MNKDPLLIVMLTHDDKTVLNARELFETCSGSSADYFGFKEEPLPPNEMKELYALMKKCGKKTVLEVVAYDEKKCLEGAELAVWCGCDMLMGTMYYDSVAELCRKNGLKYLPFVGEVTGRPSVLGGTIEGMIAEAAELAKKGVDGFDLLGYRFTEDASELIARFVEGTDLPVVIAGSINSYERLDEIKKVDPWGFTIGSAFFENKFGGSFTEQINNVCSYIAEGAEEAVVC